MKPATFFTSLASLAVAQAQYFSVVTEASNTPVNGLQWAASGNKITVGGNTASYCPDVAAQAGACPPGKHTNFALGSNSVLLMGASVPGGQSVYVDSATGAVMYTMPHSSVIPEGAVQQGWTLDGSQLKFAFELVACNTTECGDYNLYALLSGATKSGSCFSLTGFVSSEPQVAAWQYF